MNSNSNINYSQGYTKAQIEDMKETINNHTNELRNIHRSIERLDKKQTFILIGLSVITIVLNSNSVPYIVSLIKAII